MRKFAAAALLSMVFAMGFAAPASAAQHHAVKHPKAAHAKNPYVKHPVKHHVDHPAKHQHRLWPFHKH